MGVIDNRPAAIREVSNAPGVYAVISGPVIWFLEVAVGGFLYQLKPECLRRDGRLNQEGWNPDARPIRLVQLTSDHIGLPLVERLQLIARAPH